MIEVGPLPNDLHTEWDAFVRGVHQHPLFCESAWIESFDSLFGAKPMRHIAVQDDKIVGGIVTFERTRGAWIVSVPFPLSLYNGVILPHTQVSDVSKSVSRYVRERLHYASLSMAEGNEKWMREEGNWAFTSLTSRKLSLASPEMIWENYSQSLRRKIRRVQDAKLSCCESTDHSVLVDLHLKSYARHNLKPPFDRSQLLSLLERLTQKSLIKLYHVLRFDGTISAARAIAFHGTKAYDLLAGSEPTIPDDASSHFLVHSILERLSKEGFTSFDFMGTNTPGVRDFKIRFGGEEVAYVQAVYYRNAFVRGADAVNGFFHRVARRVK